jgi:hypothetical protein
MQRKSLTEQDGTSIEIPKKDRARWLSPCMRCKHDISIYPMEACARTIEGGVRACRRNVDILREAVGALGFSM